MSLPQEMWNQLVRTYGDWQDARRNNSPGHDDHRRYCQTLETAYPYIRADWDHYLSIRDSERGTDPITERVTVPAAPRVPVTMGEPDLSPGAAPRSAVLMLNTRTGHLWVSVADWDHQPEYRPGFSPNYYPAGDLTTVPEILGWPAHGHLSNPDADEDPEPPTWQDLTRTAAPTAQQLLDNLLTVPGTDMRDWTPAAARANATLRVTADGGKTFYTPYYADVRDHITPAHLKTETLSDPVRDTRTTAAWINNMILRGGQVPDPERALSGPDQRDHPPIQLLGIIAWLHGLRQTLADDLTPVEARTWFMDRVPQRIRAETTDAGISRLAESEENAARRDGVRVFGAERYLKQQRQQLRCELRAELEEAGSTIKYLETELRAARARRSAALTAVLSYSTESDAELGRTARMSRQAVAQARERLDNNDTNEMKESTK